MPNPTHMLKLSLQRLVNYIDHLPLFARLSVVLMTAGEVISLLPWWDIKAWGRLEPSLFGLSTSMWSFLLSRPSTPFTPPWLVVVVGKGI